jgi:hypothetical protein
VIGHLIRRYAVQPRCCKWSRSLHAFGHDRSFLPSQPSIPICQCAIHVEIPICSTPGTPQLATAPHNGSRRVDVAVVQSSGRARSPGGAQWPRTAPAGQSYGRARSPGGVPYRPTVGAQGSRQRQRQGPSDEETISPQVKEGMRYMQVSAP